MANINCGYLKSNYSNQLLYYSIEYEQLPKEDVLLAIIKNERYVVYSSDDNCIKVNNGSDSADTTNIQYIYNNGIAWNSTNSYTLETTQSTIVEWYGNRILIKSVENSNYPITYWNNNCWFMNGWIKPNVNCEIYTNSYYENELLFDNKGRFINNKSNQKLVKGSISLNGNYKHSVFLQNNGNSNYMSFYAPTTNGTNGQVLVASGNTPTWMNVENIIEPYISTEQTQQRFVFSYTNNGDFTDYLPQIINGIDSPIDLSFGGKLYLYDTCTYTGNSYNTIVKINSSMESGLSYIQLSVNQNNYKTALYVDEGITGGDYIYDFVEIPFSAMGQSYTLSNTLKITRIRNGLEIYYNGGYEVNYVEIESYIGNVGEYGDTVLFMGHIFNVDIFDDGTDTFNVWNADTFMEQNRTYLEGQINP